MKLSDYKLLDKSSSKNKFAQVVEAFNNTSTPYPDHATIHSLFREMVVQHPDQVAMEWVDDAGQPRTCTYAQLDRDSDGIARFLQSQGIKAEETVALLLESFELLIPSVLGILKCGAAYTALSPSFPFDRNKYILTDTAARLLLSEKKFIKELHKLQWECAALSTFVCLDCEEVYQEEEAANELMKKELWDYVGEESVDDISGGGWVNSFTGENLSRLVMDEYGDNILKKLTPLLRPTDKVLEIGCSSGISMFRLAPLVAEYHGTDLSDEILKKTEQERQQRGLSHVKLHVLPAHQVQQTQETDFDVIIINSVIQCFNGHNYLRQVLASALALLKNEGLIFIGDVMDQDSKSALIDALWAFKRENAGKGYQTKTDWSNELFISRNYFHDLRRDYPEIQAVIHSEKIYTEASELTDFRYDTVLKVNKQAALEGKEAAPDKTWHKWQLGKTALAPFQHGEAISVGGPRNLAYISYTSGTTGKPKGVQIEHRSVVRLVKNTNFIQIDPKDKLSQTAPLSFDASTFEIWGALLNGATVCAIAKNDLLNPAAFETILKQAQVTVCWLTASLFNRLLDECPASFSSLRALLVGGDTLSTVHINRLRAENPGLEVINGYGPTENTTFSACFSIDQAYEKSIPIGKPVANSQCYVLNTKMEPVPVGMNGELYVSGDGLARGYLNDAVLTAEKFIDHPFKEGEKIYKTGDLAKWLPDGTLRFLGRNDDQVKIRGFRVELGEIENTIRTLTGVKEVVVTVRKHADEEKYLCAYLIAEGEFRAEDLKKDLSAYLPAYMVPTYLVGLKEFPLNANGKVEKRLLPDPQLLNNDLDKGYTAPRTPLEKDLAGVWQAVLSLPLIGIQENFFAIGGHSLKATQVVSRVQKDLGLDLTIREMFMYPTLLTLSSYLAKKSRLQVQAIVPVATQEYYELSFAQSRLWVLNQFEEERIAYNVPGAFILDGLNPEAFGKAFQTLVERHESLRTVFVQIDGEPKQKILDLGNDGFNLGYLDLRNRTQPMAAAEKLAYEEATTSFDLVNGPLLRVKLLHLEADKYLFLFTMHHIISDGWSLGVLVKEVVALYNAYCQEKSNPLAPLRVQYKDYAAWQREQLSGESLRKHQEYWHQQLAGELPVLSLPTDYARPTVKTTQGKVLQRKLGKNVQRSLTELSQKHGASLFITLLAAAKTLFYKYTGQEDLLVGTLIAGREHHDLDNQIGFYVNTLALRTPISGNDRFTALLGKVTAATLDAFEHQVYPFDRLVDELNVRRDLSRSPIFDVLITFQNTGLENAFDNAMDGVTIQSVDHGFTTSKFDLTLTFEESPQGLRIQAEYNVDLFAESRINRLLDHFTTLLQSILHNSDASIHALEYLSEVEKEQLVQGFNQAAIPARGFNSIHQWIEQQVVAKPNKTAIQFGEEALSYAQLNDHANQLARSLREQYGVQANDLIGVSMNRSADLVTTLLAILKAGAAYLPLDPSYPAHRIAYIVRDSQAKMVIQDEDGGQDWDDWAGERVAFADLLSEAQTFSTSNLEASNQSADLAYVLYTSGSTGNPKGVMIAHASVVNFLESMQVQPGFTEADTLLSVTPYSFDISVLEMFLPLVSGATLWMADQSSVREPQKLMELMRKAKPSVMQATPSLWKMLLESGWKGDVQLKVLCGGEAMPEQLGLTLLQQTGELWNMYGPTETTIWSVIKHIRTKEDLGSIGKPIQHTQVYILDSALQPVPIGIEGELCIGGAGLAKGYWGQPELTQQKFIQSPFHENEQIYLTGDVASWLENGELKFIGRKDNQVKIHGYRIELGEIESTLRNHPAVEDAAAQVFVQGDSKELAAYLVIRSSFEPSDVRQYLSASLPAYMVPHHLVYLEKLPLTANGKLDRKALPVPNKAASVQSVFVPLTTITEQKVALAWEKILGVGQIGAADNFFERGGHSLKATQLLSWIHQVFGVRLLLRDIFTYNTIRDLCRLIDQSARTSYEAITPLAAMEYYELSHAQKQLWVLDQMTENQVAYNIPGAYWFKGALNRDAFEKTIATLIERHESLRTTFVSIQGEPKQRIQSAEAFLLPLEYIDLRKEVNPAERARGIADSEAQKPFDLEKGPLIRVKLVHLEEEAYVFVFVMHHIISDGWSMEVLKQELLTLYQAYVSGQSNPLPPLRVQYKDYAAWHNTHLSGTPLVAHQTYWLNQFQGEIPVLNLPTDFPRPSIKSFKGAIKRVALGKALSEGMNQYSQEKGVSLFMTLQALLKALMHRYTGQEDIVIGSVEAGRSHHSLENQIGYYLNTVALRTRFEGAGSFDDLLMAVKETTLATFEHHLYPFDALVKELGVDRDMSRTPLFDISMSLQNLNIAEAHPDGLDAVDVSDLEIDLTISKFDLNFVFIMVEDGLLVQAEYCTDLFTSERIDHLVGHLQGLIQAVLTDSSVPVNKLDYLPATEKQQLTLGFNDTARDFPDHLTMPEVFEQMVALYPSNQAVVIHEQAFTYQEINEAANQLAHYLRETYQIVPDEAIGLMVNRSERLIIGILGILKAGGAYLPIDPDYPEDRKAYILADAKVRILLTEMDYLFSVPSFEGELAALDVQLPGLTTSKANPARLATPENLAYLIYTSGSTGKPKGVMVEHRGNVNMALDQIQRFGVGEEDKVLQFASCSFDASVYEIFMALYAGATLVLLDKPLINDPALFVDYLQAKGVTVVTLPPVYLATLNKTNLDFLGVIITAGEAANVSDAIACSEFSTYYNAYGPTEASVCVTTYQVTEADQGKPSIPVGYPISNTQIYLLDAQGELVPLGIEGEICIAGAGLARGYVSNSALTDTHFKEHAQLQTRYYRTGDIGKRLASGAIEFIGRRDSQLKVRGYRIEPGEIVALIASQPGVQDAYILPRGSKASGQTLTAIVIPDRSFGQFGIGTPEASALLASVKEACKAALPSYMVPSAFRVMADLPLTTHGKVDKEALLQLEETILDEEAVYIAPATSLEKQLVSIWEEILDRSPIGMRDNFFELGGHSLKATQVVSRIHQETGAKIELGSIFNRPTIEELAELILKSETSIRFESIPAAAQQAYYPLSQAQRRLWVLNQMEENQLIYNIPTAYLLQGDLNISAFQQAFHAIVARYEILRTTFLFSDHEPQQQVHAYDSFGLQLAVQDLRGADNPEAEAKAQSEQESNIPFDLEKGPLLRAKLLQLADQRSLFLLTFHHIITDGWSIELLTNELLALYNTFLRGEENPLPELSIQYKDYCVWQHEQLKGEHFKKLQTYWLTQLSGQIPVLELPTDKKRPEVKTFHGEQVELVLDPTLVQRLKAISQEHDASLFIALLSSVYAFLSRYSGQKDMVLGTALAGRPHQDLEKQVGFFINTLALRNEIKETDTFSSLLKRVRENTLSAFEHQEYPFDRLVNELDLSRDVSRHPLFDVLVESSSMDIYQQPRQEMEGLSVEPFHADSLISKFDLSFRFNEQSDNRLALRLEFNTDLFAKSWIDRMLAHYQILLQSLTEAFHQPLFSLPFYAKEELQLVYGHWTEKKLLPIPPHTILDLWAQQLQINPQAAAIRFGKDVLTYQEVEASANRLAHHLITTAAVASDDVIGLLARRSPNVIIAMLGILKAGASFLPIDPQMPTGRIGYMLSEVKVKMLLLDSEFLADIDAYYQGSLFALDIQLAGLDESDITPVTLPTPQQLAYVIYTSGSTGKPKAVGVEHSNLYHYITWANEYYFGNLLGHPFALFTSLSFDLTITSIFSTLTRGDALSILEEKDVHELLQEQFGETSQVNAVKMTPSHVSILEQLALSKTSVSTVILGGEQVKQTHVQTLRRLNPAMKIYNEYGPTETTVGCSIQELVGDEELINIGKPIINTDIFIVDDQLNLLPAFIPGELCIGGIGVARGYLNNAEQSAQKFIINPHVAGQRIYRTGDVGYWLPNGEIVLKGRTDEQVKIRGNRIELGEIAHLLSENEQVRDAFVHTVGEGEAKQLVAYVVGSPDLQETALRAYLEQRLPAYMVPQYILILDTFKLNSNGKIDRQALPVPDSRHINALAYVAPRTPTEEKLVEIWQEVLEKSPIGIHDNLFVLGGHSLKAIMIVSRIQKELGAKIDLGILFSQPTIAGLSDEIAHTGSEAAAAIVPLPWQEYYDVSNAQRRLWVLNQLEDDLTAYNIPTAVVFEGSFDRKAFEKAFQSIVERHESLRTSFVTIDGLPKQKIVDGQEMETAFVYQDLREDASREAKTEAIAEEMAHIVFDLANPPLYQARLVQLEEYRYVFFFTVHHIISDGWSANVLINEIVALYQAYQQGEANLLAPLRIQYKDYAAWQNEQLAGNKLQKHQDYWKNQFSAGVPVLELPTDYPRPEVKTFHGKAIASLLDKEESQALKELGAEFQASMFMTLCATVKALLYQYTGQNDIVVGTPSTLRNHQDLENQIGLYINTLAIVTTIDEQDAFIDLLLKVKANVSGALAFQHYPFDRLVDDLTLERDMSRSPLFDVMVVSQDFDLPLSDQESEAASFGTSGTPELSVFPYPTELTSTKYDLTFNFKDAAEGLHLVLEYNTDLFSAARIEQLLAHYKQLVIETLLKRNTPIGQLELLSAPEKATLVLGYNETEAAYATENTVVRQFENRVASDPQAVAVRFGDSSLSYHELNEASNRLAHYLRDQVGIAANELVCLLMDRSEQMMVALLGILKSGAGYVPIDPSYPLERIRHIIAETGTKCLITDASQDAEILANEGCTILSLPNHAVLSSRPATNLAGQAKPEDLAYVMYTSGSTGLPKGVEITVANLTNYLTWANSYYYTNEKGKNTALFTSLSFDLTVTSIFTTLLRGDQLVIFPQQAEIIDILRHIFDPASDIQAVKLTPSHVSLLAFLDLPVTNIAYAILGGEALTQVQVNLLWKLNPAMRLFNEYGPTETTVGSTIAELLPGNQLITIGKPIANTKIFILNKAGKVVPAGIWGEIAIGGSGVAKGYFKNPALTQEKFVVLDLGTGTPERIYWTGDLGRWLPDGNIEYQGRKDTQVKLRGQRIELGEIENALLQHPSVKSAAAAIKSDMSQEPCLVGYVVSEEPLEPIQLRTHLAEYLPAYMIPAFFLCLDRLPLNTNGKLDRKALSAPEAAMLHTGVEQMAPRNEIEQLLVTVIGDVLGKQALSVLDNFFTIGGDSIKAIQIASKISHLGYKVTTKDIFQYPTVEELAQVVRLATRVADQSPVVGEVPLTPIQHAFFAQIATDAHHYNQAIMLSSTELPREAIQVVFNQLIAHHDALRLTYRQEEGKMVQYSQGLEWQVELQEYELSDRTDAVEWLESKANELQASLNLEDGPLMQLALFHMPEGDRLLMIFHHLLIDGLSWRILFEDLETLYRQYKRGEKLLLPLKTDAYQRWAQKLEEHANSEVFLKEGAYWQNLLSANMPTLRRDNEVNQSIVAEERSVGFDLTREETKNALTKVNLTYKTDMNDLLLTALGVAIQQVFGLDRVMIDLEGHGREEILADVDVSRTVGWFTSIYPVVLTLPSDQNLGYRLKTVKEDLRQVPNKGIGYGLLKYLTSQAHKPAVAFDQRASIVFNYLGQIDEDIKNMSMRLADEFSGATQSPNGEREHDLVVTAVVVEKQLRISVKYSYRQYKAETMRALVDAYQKALQELIDHCMGLEHKELVTPSDLGFQGLTIDQLENFFKS